MELGQHWNAKLVSHCESRIQARHCESRSEVAIHASTPRPMDRFVPRDDGAGVLRPRPGHCKSLTQLRHCESRTQARHCESRSDVAIHAYAPRPMDRFVPRDDGAGVLRPCPGHCQSRTQPPSLPIAHSIPSLPIAHPIPVIARIATLLALLSMTAAKWSSQ